LITLVTIVHIFVSVVLVLVILLQAGKSGGMGAAFGGGSQTVFGGRGAQTFLGKVTSACAAIFMLTSVTLAVLSSRTGSVVKAAPPPQAPVPGAPAGSQVPAPFQVPGQAPVSVPLPGSSPAPAAPASSAPAPAPAKPAPAPAK